MAGIVLLVLKSCTTGILGTIRNGPNFAGNPRTSSARRLLRVVLRWGTVVPVRRCLAEVPGCLLPLQLDGLAVAPVALCGCPLLLVFLRHLAEVPGCLLLLRLDGLAALVAALCGCPLLLVFLQHLAEVPGCLLLLRLDGLAALVAALCGCPLLLVFLLLLAEVPGCRPWRLLSVLVLLQVAFLSQALLLDDTRDSCSSLASGLDHIHTFDPLACTGPAFSAADSWLPASIARCHGRGGCKSSSALFT